MCIRDSYVCRCVRAPPDVGLRPVFRSVADVSERRQTWVLRRDWCLSPMSHAFIPPDARSTLRSTLRSTFITFIKANLEHRHGPHTEHCPMPHATSPMSHAFMQHIAQHIAQHIHHVQMCRSAARRGFEACFPLGCRCVGAPPDVGLREIGVYFAKPDR